MILDRIKDEIRHGDRIEIIYLYYNANILGNPSNSHTIFPFQYCQYIYYRNKFTIKLLNNNWIYYQYNINFPSNCSQSAY